MRRRLFTIAAIVSLLCCLFCAWAGMSYFYFWRHGVIAVINGNEQVVHLASDLEGAKFHAIWAVVFAVFPVIRLLEYIGSRWKD